MDECTYVHLFPGSMKLNIDTSFDWLKHFKLCKLDLVQDRFGLVGRDLS